MALPNAGARPPGFAPRGSGATELVRRALKDVAWKAQTLGRVPLRTGMHESMHLGGAALLLRELPRQRSAPSLLFRFLAHNDPHRIGLIVPNVVPDPPRLDDPRRDRIHSFFEIDEMLDRVALALASRGVRRGTSVLVALKNRAEAVLVPGAIGRLGAAAVTVSWRSTPPELEYIAKHSGAEAFVFDHDVAEVAREALRRMPSIRPEAALVVGGEAEGFARLESLAAGEHGKPPEAGDEAAVVMYTSGTTGKPKGAVRTFAKGALLGALAFIGETPMHVGDVHLAVCPLYHATAVGFITFSYLLGSTVVVLPDFRPETFLEAIERYRVTTTAVVPTMLHRLAELGPTAIRRYDTSSLKAIFSGGSALSAPLANAVMDALGDKVFNFYGATETGVVTLATPEDLRASPGTIGRVLPGNEVRLVDESGRDVPPGVVGELFVRSALLVDGYHGDRTATDEAMREGFFSVGDLARVDERGCLHLEGRKRDMIISGGVNVYPAEVEAAIEAHPGVAEVAVVGAPDPEWGERVRAFVVARRGATCTEADLRAHCKERLAGPKVPREFVFLEVLPRNPTGKVLKRELRVSAHGVGGGG